MGDDDVSLRDYVTALLRMYEDRCLERHRTLEKQLGEFQEQYRIAHEDLRSATDQVRIRVATVEGSSGGQNRLISMVVALTGMCALIAAVIISVVR